MGGTEMECPKCGIEANVVESREVSNLGTPYLYQAFACRNPKCENYKKIIDEKLTKEN
jgi:hypothetical protein